MKRCDDDWFRVLRTYNRYIILITVLLECINLYIYIYIRYFILEINSIVTREIDPFDQSNF